MQIHHVDGVSIVRTSAELVVGSFHLYFGLESNKKLLISWPFSKRKMKCLWTFGSSALATFSEFAFPLQSHRVHALSSIAKYSLTQLNMHRISQSGWFLTAFHLKDICIPTCHCERGILFPWSSPDLPWKPLLSNGVTLEWCGDRLPGPSDVPLGRTCARQTLSACEKKEQDVKEKR